MGNFPLCQICQHLFRALDSNLLSFNILRMVSAPKMETADQQFDAHAFIPGQDEIKKRLQSAYG